MRRVIRKLVVVVMMLGIVLCPFIPSASNKLSERPFAASQPLMADIPVQPSGWMGGGSST